MFKYLLTTAVLFSSLWFHPIHVSICEIEYDQDNKALEMTMRIFLDDLEKEIRLMKKDPEMDLTNLKNGQNLDQILQEYLLEKFRVSVNDKKSVYNYIGHEIEGDAVFCYMEISKVKKLKSVEVYNATLTDLYEDQTNLVHIEVAGEIRSMRLSRADTEDRLEY